MPVGVKDVRGLLGGSVLSLSLEAIRDEQAGRQARRVRLQIFSCSPDLQEIFPCVASINPHLLCHISLHVPCVCFPLWLSAPVCAVVPPYLRLLVSHFLAVIAVGNNNLRQNKTKTCAPT